MQDVLQILGEGSLQELKEVVAQLEAAEKLIADINTASSKMDFTAKSAKTFNEMAAAAKEAEANTVAMRNAADGHAKAIMTLSRAFKGLSEEQQKAALQAISVNEDVKKTIQGIVAEERKRADDRKKAMAEERELDRLIREEQAERRRKAAADERELNRLIAKEEREQLEKTRAEERKTEAERKEAAKEYQDLWVRLLKERDAKAAASKIPNDSIKGMARELAALRKEYDLLTAVQREDLLIGGQKLKQIQALDAELKQLEGSTGRFQRNVGNYEGAITPIQRQISLLAGELPNIQFGFRTFAASLSNQVAGFTDAIKQTAAANRQLKAEGKETVSVFRQITQAAGGWQVWLLAAIGVLPVLYDWLFKNTEQTKKMSESAKENTDSMKKMTEQIGKEVSELNYLVIKAQDANRSYKERGAAVDELQKKFPEYFGSLSREVILNGDVKTAVDAVTQSIINRAKEMQRVEKLNKVLTEIAATEVELDLLTKNRAGTFRVVNNDEIEALRRKLSTLEIERKNIENNIKAATDYGAKDAYWIDNNAKKRYDANEERQRQLALMTEEERKAAEKKQTSDDKEFERRKKAIEELNKTIAKIRLGFEQPTEQEMKEAIAELQSSLDGQDIILTKRVDLAFGKIGQNVADAQAKSNENLLGIELAFQNQLFGSYEEYEKAKTEETYRASKERVQIQIDGLKEILSYLPENSKQRKEITDKLHEYELALVTETNKKTIDGLRKTEEERRAEIEKSISKFDDWSGRILGLSSTIGETFGNIYQKRISELESLNNAIDQNLQKEIEAIKLKGLSQKEQEEQIALAKAKAAVAEEKNNKKIAEYRERQAKLDKAIAIASILQNTSVAVMQFWSKGNIPLAIAAGVAGLAQAAEVASRPIPKYEKGTQNSEGGPAIVSEKGQELVIEPDGRQWLTPEKEAIVMLKKHSKVIPHHKLMEMHKSDALNMALLPVSEGSQFDDRKIVEGLVSVYGMNKAILREMEKSNAIAQKNSRHPNYNFREGYYNSMYR